MEWDFDAPQFVDFTKPQAHEHEYDDSWFDRHTEDDDFLLLGKKQDGDGTSSHQTQKAQRVLRSTGGSAKKNNEMAESTVNRDTPQSNCGPSPTKKAKKSSEDNSRNIYSPAGTNCYQPNKCYEQLEHEDSDCPAANTRRRSSLGDLVSGSPRNLLHAKSPNKKAVKSPRLLTKSSIHLGISHSNRYQSPASNVAVVKPLGIKRSQSLRNVPLTRSESKLSTLAAGEREHKHQEQLSCYSSGKMVDSDVSISTAVKVKSTEELQLEEIAAIKKKAARTRQRAQDFYKKSMTSNPHVPLRSTQPATVAVSFNFKTDERIKESDNRDHEQKTKDFAKSLREALPHPVLPTKPQRPGLTRPQPFKLTSAKSTSSVVQAEKYESVAEKIIAFQRKTPDRFRSRAHGSNERARSAQKTTSNGGRRMRSQSPMLTEAKTPKLLTRGRTRPNPPHILSREEKERLEFEEHQKQQFKAHPINPRVFEAPSVPKVATKPPTVVEEFQLHGQRAVSTGNLSTAMSDTEEKFEFHAKPLNPRILAGPVGVKPIEPKPITVPESPAFALKNRLRPQVEQPRQEEVKEVVKVNPVPHTGIPFKPRLAHHFTVPEPFAVEERSREMLNRREQKIQHILEEEKKAHEFHAQDLPSDSPDPLPPKQPKPLTHPEPFHLEVDERGERYQKEFQTQQLEEEEKALRELANFKAGPNQVIRKEPFQAQKSTKPLTERSNIVLNTDVRANQREVFDQRVKAKEAEIEALKRQREDWMKKEQEAEVARLRIQNVHKATGIKRYKSVTVKPSDKPLTDAQSPRFSQRLKSKHNTSTDL